MFTQLSIMNFKGWKGTHTIELAPLSLFLGTNSAGKTSLLQMLLLLKQTAESPDRRQHLNLGGQSSDLLDLGGFKDIISAHDIHAELAFGMHYTSAPTKKSSRRIDFRYDVSFSHAHGGVPVVKSLRYASADQGIFKAERQRNGAYRLTLGEAPDAESTESAGPLPAKKTYEPERAIAFSAAAVADLGREGSKIQDLTLQMIQALKGIVYLGPLRERPKRVYPWNQQAPGDLGRKGELAIQALLASANTRTKRTATGGQGWLVERVAECLRRMDIADNLRLEQEGNSAFHQVLVKRGGTEANLVDVGFGVSQVLPVVTLAYFVPEGSTVILEQPEIHLHPLAQTALADLLVEVSRTRRVQFLVETHSEHLFRRLQFLIADEQISPEDCQLYFVKRGEESAILERLEVDEFGRVKNWPERFFGDAIGEVERQTRRMIERKTMQPRS
jgi:predicted ATPase